MNIFEVASRNSFRFNFKGVISTDELWNLSVQNLDIIFKDLNSQLKKVEEESLLGEKSSADKEIEIKIEIVKHIVKVKLEEKEKKETMLENKAKREKILEIMSKKQNENLEGKSEEELKAMLDELK